MMRADPHTIAREQLARDAHRCAAYAGLYEHKLERMRASPLAFLRGAAPLFYTLLRANPELARGPRGEGWICGDLHVENFGAYRPASLLDEEKKKRVREHAAAFDLNDFDDAVVGPWRFDVLRLTTSLLLAGREFGVRGDAVIEMAGGMLESYVAHACHKSKMPPIPRPVEKLLQRVRTRTRVELLDARTKLAHGKRRFVRGPRYREVPKPLQKKARRAFEAYAARLEKKEKIAADHLEILDMAFRVAGTGSLGGLRVAVLARGKGGPDGAWIFDMKEEGTPSAAIALGKQGPKPAKRVLQGMSACMADPPRMLGTTKLAGRSMLVRRLSPQEDKLDLTHLDPADLVPLAKYLGALTGAAHRRGATRPPKKSWKKADCAVIIDRAIALAGLHEAAYLAMCRHA